MTSLPVNTTVSTTSIDINSMSTVETINPASNDDVTSSLINEESKSIDKELKDIAEDKKNDSKGKDKLDNIEEKDDLIEEESVVDRNLRIKRENHNALERKRRIFQKSKLEELKNRLPPLNTKKPSTITIMCKAIEYIDSLKQQLEEKRKIGGESIETYKTENKSLKKRLSIITKENEKLKHEIEKLKNNENKKENGNDDEKELANKSSIVNVKSENIREDKDKIKNNKYISDINNEDNKSNEDTTPSTSSSAPLKFVSVTIPTNPTSYKMNKQLSKVSSESFTPNKKQKLNSGDSISTTNINSSNSNDSSKDNIEISKVDNKSQSTTPTLISPVDDSSASVMKTENESLSKDIIDALNDNNSLISTLNNISIPMTDENLSQTKPLDIPSVITSTTEPLSLLNQVINTNETIDLNVGTPIKLSSDANNMSTPDSLVIPNMSTLSPNNNQNLNGMPLQYPNSLKTIPMSTPPESNVVDSQSNLPIQNIPIIQEPSPVQIQKSNAQSMIVQHPRKPTTISSIATPINSPSLSSINIPINSMNPQLANINVPKRGSMPIPSKVNTVNPSPVMNYHHPVPHNSAQTLNNPHNSQRIYASNMQTYRKTKSYPIQQSPHLSIQTQVPVYTNPQLHILTNPNQLHSPINDNINFQYPQNVAVQGQNIINMPPSTSIQIQNNTITPAGGASLPNNFVQPNFINQVNGINNISNMNTFNANGAPIQVIQQPLQSTMVGQNVVNPQIPKNNQNINNPNNNNVVYYY